MEPCTFMELWDPSALQHSLVPYNPLPLFDFPKHKTLHLAKSFVIPQATCTADKQPDVSLDNLIHYLR